MSWFLPLVLFVLGVCFWVASHKAEELIVAWVRWVLAVCLVVVAALLVVVQC